MIRLRVEWRDVKVGARFHKLTVVGQQFRIHTGKPKPKWGVVVRCDCGNFKVVYAADLPRGFQKSCGCHRVEDARRKGRNNKRHGEAKSKLYTIWHLMKLRCFCSSQPAYPKYGGIGVTVCDEWKNSYEEFRDFALSSGWHPNLQIDR